MFFCASIKQFTRTICATYEHMAHVRCSEAGMIVPTPNQFAANLGPLWHGMHKTMDKDVYRVELTPREQVERTSKQAIPHQAVNTPPIHSLICSFLHHLLRYASSLVMLHKARQFFS